MQRWDGNDIGSEIRMDINTLKGKFYYSVFSQTDCTINSNRADDNPGHVVLNFMLADNATFEQLIIIPDSDVDHKCWHVFMLDTDDGSLYIKNKGDNKNTNNTCGTSFTTDGLVPF